MQKHRHQMVFKTLGKILQWGVFLGVLYYLYVVFYKVEFQKFKHLFVQMKSPLFLCCAGFGTAFVFLGEMLKLKTLYKASWRHIFLLVAGGMTTAMLTPNRWGNFVGRMMIARKKEVVWATIYGNMAQFMATFTMALIGVFVNFGGYLNVEISFLSTYIIWFLIVWALFFGGYFYVEIILNYLVKRFAIIRQIFKNKPFIQFYKTVDKWKLLGCSLLKYILFCGQLYGFIYVFGGRISGLEYLAFVGILYGIITIFPSPILGNLGNREAVGVWLLSGIVEKEVFLLASFGLWFFNILLPFFLGAVMLLKKRNKL